MTTVKHWNEEAKIAREAGKRLGWREIGREKLRDTGSGYYTSVEYGYTDANEPMYRTDYDVECTPEEAIAVITHQISRFKALLNGEDMTVDEAKSAFLIDFSRPNMPPITGPWPFDDKRFSHRGDMRAYFRLQLAKYEEWLTVAGA